MKTKHHSLLLGKHELHEMSSLQVRDEDSYFVFPEFSDDMTKRVFGEATNVHVQVMCEFNHQNEQILYLRYRYLNLIISLSILREASEQYLFHLMLSLFNICITVNYRVLDAKYVCRAFLTTKLC